MSLNLWFLAWCDSPYPGDFGNAWDELRERMLLASVGPDCSCCWVYRHRIPSQNKKVPSPRCQQCHCWDPWTESACPCCCSNKQFNFNRMGSSKQKRLRDADNVGKWLTDHRRKVWQQLGYGAAFALSELGLIFGNWALSVSKLLWLAQTHLLQKSRRMGFH